MCHRKHTLLKAFLLDGSKHNASTRAQKPSAGGMGNIIFDAVACEVSQQASNLELKHKWGGELTVLLEGCTVKNISKYGASCNHGDFFVSKDVYLIIVARMLSTSRTRLIFVSPMQLSFTTKTLQLFKQSIIAELSI